MRSALGARFAVDIAERCLRNSLNLDPRKIVKNVTAKILHEWRMACLSHFRGSPLSPRERKISGGNGFDLAWYGTTLVCAAITPTYAMIIQIGDGDAMAFLHDGSVVHPIPGSNLPSGITHSLCEPSALQEFRCHFLAWPASARIKAIILCTDGVANSYSPKSLEAFGSGIIYAMHADREEALSQLETWLPELYRRGNADDMGIAGLIVERKFLSTLPLSLRRQLARARMAFRKL